VGDPARANMLTSLMGGEALTAGELAHVADIAAATASGHLARLLDGGLVVVTKQGRHRYYRLASPEVAAAIEMLMELSLQTGHRRFRPGPRDPELRKARVCYDHLAGERGVELFARLTRLELIALDDGSVAVTARGERQLGEFGVDICALKSAKRPICRTCLDWSERRSHLAGALGARLLDRFFELNWARRINGTRIVRFSPRGEARMAALFQ
jgi:DNA-binding transcriptional ArsR family regulator